MAAAVANENIRILESEGVVERVHNHIGPYLRDLWDSLVDHPLIGEVKVIGMMGSTALTPNKETRATFYGQARSVGLIYREKCFDANLIMRAVGDRMVISPPLIITKKRVSDAYRGLLLL